MMENHWIKKNKSLIESKWNLLDTQWIFLPFQGDYLDKITDLNNESLKRLIVTCLKEVCQLMSKLLCRYEKRR